MKYTVAGFQQASLLVFGLGVEEAEILRCIVDFWFSKRMETKFFDGREYFYLTYGFVMGELPILKLTRKQVAEKMQRFVECGLMEYQIEKGPRGSKVYFSINEDSYLSLIETQIDAKPRAKALSSDAPAKIEKNEIKEYFYWLYMLKAKEVTGSDTTPEGKKKTPMWGAKEATLLKSDHLQFGPEAMKRFMRVFFSDSNNEIAQFTRWKAKAGYGYPVFHSMLAKLSVSDHDVREPCRICGYWKGHAGSCTVEKEKLAELKKIEEDDAANREEHPEDYDIDLFKLFDDKVRLKKGDATSLPVDDGQEAV